MRDISNFIEKQQNLIFEAADFIWKHPETGYREVVTSEYLAEQFEKLGYDIVKAEEITGFYTIIDTGRPGPEVMILGEMDSIICPSHPAANKETGAVHACGHHQQSAVLLGIAAALKEPGALEGLCGRIRLCAVPAEELLEIEYRSKLREQGIIKYYGGKNEFLHRGYFDSVDLAFMVHSGNNFNVYPIWDGCLVKNIIYKGTSAHAGGAPWEGNNALYAATCGINAVNAIRETFKDTDYVRVHPIITHGGDIVNAIPESVRMESFVRGSTVDAIAKANNKVNQALIGGALSLNNNIEIIDISGYSPLINNTDMIELAKEVTAAVIPDVEFTVNDGVYTVSTDMGDLSMIMPVFHPCFGGCKGSLHANNFEVSDPEVAYLENAKFQLGMLFALLSNGGKKAKEVVANYKPQFATKEEFLSYVDHFENAQTRISYHEDGTATIRL